MMPRPITKTDVNRWRKYYGRGALTFSNHKVLGIVVKCSADYLYDRRVISLYDDMYAYNCTKAGDLMWVSEKTLNKRKKIGRPGPKLHLREPDFGLEEMALAEAIMNGG